MIAAKFTNKHSSKKLEQEELIFLAQDTVENIRHLKNVSHTVLAGHIATFGYVSHLEPNKANVAISIFFLFSCLICIYLFLSFFPKKIKGRRERLKRIYKVFSPKFQEVHGGVNAIAENDSDDSFYKYTSVFIPIISMITIFFIQIFHADTLQSPVIIYYAGSQLSPICSLCN